MRDSTEHRKLGVSRVKHTAKTNKDLGMSCYIQVEYTFSIGSSLVTIRMLIDIYLRILIDIYLYFAMRIGMIMAIRYDWVYVL